MIQIRNRFARYAGAAIIAATLVPGAAFAQSGHAADAEDDALTASAIVASAQDNADYKDAQIAESLADLADDATASAAVVSAAAAVSVGADVNSASAASASPSASTAKVKSASKSKTTKAKKASEPTKTDKVLKYDRKLINKIGTQEKTGHTICCPSFSCAYADAVMDGTVHDHEYYTCSCCTWTDWGGGNSSFRCVGTDEELLREAYDQIKAGKPTVIHVAGSSGEHWIALIGYQNAKDPDHLKLSNFIALDPWDGAQINAADRYSLYGDGCEHISDR